MALNDHIQSGDGLCVAIVGAGIIGLTCASELARRGCNVTVFDAGQPGRGASWAAAGMLGPAYEAAGHGGHARLFELCLESARIWSDFANRLETETGQSIGYSPGPTLALARDTAEKTALKQLGVALQDMRQPYCALDHYGIAGLEPSISEGVEHGLLLPSDGQIDNRACLQALLTICAQHPSIEVKVSTPVTDLTALKRDYAHLVVTAGWQSNRLLQGLDALQPVGGQLLSVSVEESMPKLTVRSGGLYIAPKSDRVVIGATVEPGVALEQPDAQQIEALWSDAADLVPALASATLLETWCGVRPGFKDHAPVIGAVSDGILVATGHYRNGILLAPMTAQIIAREICDGASEPLAEAFAPTRFREAAGVT